MRLRQVFALSFDRYISEGLVDHAVEEKLTRKLTQCYGFFSGPRYGSRLDHLMNTYIHQLYGVAGYAT
jgi:hypothetical protein